ncbi:MAG: hypothetical protein KFB93_07175 [Simkaniaceae bacterium]|nr:MAG: hypothetical protein KFB93_07175 [Simkaniaceae bacterium]
MLRLFLRVVCLLGVASAAFGAIRGTYNNHFAIEGDYVLLRRANSHNKHLVSAAGGPVNFPLHLEPPECAKEPGKPLIESKDLIHDMHFDSGFSLALKIFPSLKTTWEARYLGGLAWTGTKSRHCLENLDLDGTVRHHTLDYQFASRVKAIYDSNMYTWELNFWRHITPRYTDYFSVSWLAGLRMFDIDEKIKLYFHKDHRTSRYRVKTANDSFGLQIGGDIEYNPYYFLTWGLVVKVGGMFNRDKQKTKMFDDNNTVEIRNIDRSGSNFSYMAEIYPFIELRPTKHFFFTINYRMLYVGAIATADQNIVFHGTGSVLDHGGHIIYHGLTAGMQFNF